MLDIKIVTNLPDDVILTTALYFRQETNQWQYSSSHWKDGEQKIVKHHEHQLAALRYHAYQMEMRCVI